MGNSYISSEKDVLIMAKESKSTRKAAPAKSIEGREQQMIALAMDLAEKKLRDGTASNMLICHFLRYGSTQNKLEQEDKKADVELKKAKVESIHAQRATEEMFAEAISALKGYQGNMFNGEDDYDDDDE